MEIKEIISTLKDKFGDTFDEQKVEALFKGKDMKDFSMKEIIEKVKNAGIIGDLDGDGVKEGLFEELKGKAEQLAGNVGNFFHKK